MFILMKSQLVNDNVAVHNIRSFISYLKERGHKRTDVIQLMMHFKYSPEKIQRIMKVLENEGLVKEE